MAELEAALLGGGEEASRSAAYGLAAAGDAAVPILLKAVALVQAGGAAKWLGPNSAHSLADATAGRTSEVFLAVAGLLVVQAAQMAELERIGPPLASRESQSDPTAQGLNHPAAVTRRTMVRAATTRW